MPADTTTLISPPSDPEAKSATLFEQIGTTSALSKSTTFQIDLESGGTESAINPLPDLDE